MKTLRLVYLSIVLAVFAMYLSSCSSTQQFAGTYPKNNITGKGFGYGVTQSKTQLDVSANAMASSTPKAVAASDVKPVEDVTPAPVVTKHKLREKIEAKMTKYVMNFWAKHPIDAAASAEKKNTMGSRIYSRIMKKYGITDDMVSKAAAGGGGLAGASRILAIVSLAAGCAAGLWYAGFFFGPAAIVTGVLALLGIKQGGDGRKLFAILGIAFGAFFLLFWIFFAIFFRI